MKFIFKIIKFYIKIGFGGLYSEQSKNEENKDHIMWIWYLHGRWNSDELCEINYLKK